MPILNPPTTPSQPCDYSPSHSHDEDVATTSEQDKTPSTLLCGISHWHRRASSLVVTPHLNPLATVLSPELVSADTAVPSVLQLRGGGLEATDTELASPTDKRKVSGSRYAGRYDMSPASMRSGQKSEDISIAKKSPEIITTQQSIKDYRAKLAREMEKKTQGPPAENVENIRVSPVRENLSGSPSSSSDLPTTSTGSNKTVRGGTTPGFAASTPSYPFPRMNTPGFRLSHLQNHFSPLGGRVLNDQLTSDPSTPASTMTFLPPGCTPLSENPNYPTPNLYELSLMLSAEPGLNGWWNTVVQIMTEIYKAERITLSVPADATDIDNVPWGQKATYNAQTEDDFSMGYMGRGSSLAVNSADDGIEMPMKESAQGSETPFRPSIQSRHSFTAYEEKKESRKAHHGDIAASAMPHRPGLASRSKSHFPGADRSSAGVSHTALNRQALEEHDAVEEKQPLPSWEATIESERTLKGQVLPVLQALDLNADPLIDHNGITRVIERGKVIALTRTYPYLDPGADEQPAKDKSPKPSSQDAKPKGSMKQMKSESSTNLSSLLANASAPLARSKNNKSTVPDKSKIPHLYSVINDGPPRPPTPKYEEFEQAPPSPWSQSPAPSPAVRPDPSENPFFADAGLDEGSFNPSPSPHDYTSVQPPETIGIDNSWTVLHIPLNHILLSRSPQRFKLDPSVLEQRTNLRAKHEALPSPWSVPDEPPRKHQQPPIAILSILTPVIPYPSNLRYSLEHLAPHLATSFSLCRHYSNLETEIMGLSRKRPSNTGFGAIGPDGRPVANISALGPLGLSSSEDISQRSFAGSLTSPSDYSAQSRSINGSPMGTPLWEPGSFGLVVERRVTGTSPGSAGGDSYFNSKPKGGAHAETPSGTSSHRTSRNAKEIVTNRQHQRSVSLRKKVQEPASTRDTEVSETVGHNTTNEEDISTPVTRPRHVSRDSALSLSNKEEPRVFQDVNDHPKRFVSLGNTTQGSSKHTKLHSYGGDFAATFQSLPPSTSLLTKPTTSAQVRPGSVPTTQVSMNPPTDRLKGLMLDLLPVQVFVAWPVTGEIVWVNSRYLTYRGQTLADLVSDPWASFHEEDREDYLRTWTHSLRTGEQFVHTVRLRRFDGAYRWHQARAVASRDKRGVIVQFIGSYMDIHDQKVAEFMALRQAEVEASEAKHRLLANLIPQIIFTATESDGITFANEQWLAYTGQSEDSPLGSGFLDYVHPEDLARCRVPIDRSSMTTREKSPTSVSPSTDTPGPNPTVESNRSVAVLQKESTATNTQTSSLPNADLSELAKKGIIKVTTDSNGRLSYTTELRLRSKTGEYRWHLIRCVEIDDVGFDSGPSSYFGSATDINDHKLLEAKLKEAMESKGRFLSNMSHEIRTPLIGISGMVSFLQDTTLSEEQRDFTNTIQTSANSLLMIINDILDLSKVDAGMMKLKFEWFHTRSLIEDVNELVSTMAIAKRLELNYIVEEDVPAWVKGDKFRIRQVLLNVIGNAIKFTSIGEVFSRCRIYRDYAGELGENKIMLEWSVIDTGRGFTKEEAGLIFKPFSQIDGSSTRQHGGSGLGLVISRQLVELHGGQMDGSAVPGKGSTFTFTARFDLPTAADHPVVTSTPPMAATARPEDKTMHAIRPLMLQKTLEQPIVASPSSDAEAASPAFASSGSSEPSIRSVHTQNTTSSVSSVNVGLAHFSEAARASGQDLSQMKLEMPMGRLSLQTVPTPDCTNTPSHLDSSRLPMYSILIICPQKYSREAITKHIETTLPKDVPHQITALSGLSEAENLIGGYESVTFTHVVVNLSSAEEIVKVTSQIATTSGDKTTTLIMSDSVQRQAILELASNSGQPRLLADKQIIFIHKPVKPSRFAVFFDPARERDVSTDLNRSSAAQMVESQKQSYLDVEKRIGDKGIKVLLVEDNPVNQKVLSRYLRKVGTEPEIAADGMEATEKVFTQSPKHYSLILCDLHMPRKDGYQTCQEIRQWEQENNYSPTPIIALSANVMPDVQEKCIAAGFNDFVTKPVDFVDLSTAMSKHF